MNNKVEFFESRNIEFIKQKVKAGKQASKIAQFRLLVFLLGAVLSFLAFRNDMVAAGVVAIILTISGLLVLVKRHQRAKQLELKFQMLAELNTDEIDRLNLDLRNFESGEEFIDKTHPYLTDLDIFGHHSLFQLVNRSATPLGKQKLADMLKLTVDRSTILDRQEYLQERSTDVEWQQEFTLQGKLKEFSNQSMYQLQAWLKKDDCVKGTGLIKIAQYVFPVVGTIALTLYFMSLLPLAALLAIFLFPVLLFRKNYKLIMETKMKAENQTAVLQQAFALIKMFEEAKIHSRLGKELQDKFRGNDLPTWKKIKELSSYFSNLDSTNNVVWGLIGNMIFLWDVKYLMALENWKTRYRDEVNVWFETLAEVDALNSFSGYTFSNDRFVFPQIKEGDKEVIATKMAHPLIDPKVRVANDFTIKDDGKVFLITGSNMSGKSTFQRTVGLNLVIAQMGLPVCADQFSCTPLVVFTSMRTIDSIEESTSSFYAELKRLKQLIALAEQEKNLIYFIDEILKGTNSEDRHKGSKALAAQLSKLGVFGLISTHDLALSELEDRLGHLLINYSFNSTIEGSEIKFDYKLTPGICQSFNASQLMKNMGIKIED